MARQMRGLVNKYVFFPYLISLFPILFLWSINKQYVLPGMLIRSITITLILTITLHVIIKLALRDWIKAGILTIIITIIVFSYGHIYTSVEYGELFGINLGRHRYLLGVVFLLLGLAAFILIKVKNDLTRLSFFLNVLSTLLLVYPLSSIISHEVRLQTLRVSGINQEDTYTNKGFGLDNLGDSNLGYKPDIYYIILDTYTRADILKECFDFDNGKFVSELRSMGFYVADESRSNYTITDLSIASSLNMQYLHDPKESTSDEFGIALNPQLIQDSFVQKALKRAGYTIIALDSGYTSTEIRKADIYHGYDDSLQRIYFGGMNSFESMLLKTSIGIYFFDIKEKLPNAFKMVFDSAYILHRDRILYSFEKLEEIPANEQPTFAFMHVLAPHNPFVFGPNGEFVPRNTPFTLNDDQEVKTPIQYKQGYVNQIKYINTRMVEIIKTIINESANPPIIIIQGDHGAPRWITSETGRSDILNAYLIPGLDSGLYPSITPVNTFRVVLNTVFSADLPILPDLSYYSTHKTSGDLVPLAEDDHLCGSN